MNKIKRQNVAPWATFIFIMHSTGYIRLEMFSVRVCCSIRISTGLLHLRSKLCSSYESVVYIKATFLFLFCASSYGIQVAFSNMLTNMIIMCYTNDSFSFSHTLRKNGCVAHTHMQAHKNMWGRHAEQMDLLTACVGEVLKLNRFSSCILILRSVFWLSYRTEEWGASWLHSWKECLRKGFRYSSNH